MYRCVSILIIFFQLSACAVYPKFDKEATPQCDVLTRQFTLDMMADVSACKKSDNAASALFCLGATGLVFVATAVVSGSIVIVGNTVHFLEQQGRCENSYLRRKLDQHLADSGT